MPVWWRQRPNGWLGCARASCEQAVWQVRPGAARPRPRMKNSANNCSTVPRIAMSMPWLSRCCALPSRSYASTPTLRQSRVWSNSATCNICIRRCRVACSHRSHCLIWSPDCIRRLPSAACRVPPPWSTCAAVEGLDRGWYAAPVGWLDARGEGDFAVALRSGVIRGDQAVLFAGVGVVQRLATRGASTPRPDLKLRPMLGALGVEHNT